MQFCKSGHAVYRCLNKMTGASWLLGRYGWSIYYVYKSKYMETTEKQIYNKELILLKAIQYNRIPAGVQD
jgi:hypothetical protein